MKKDINDFYLYYEEHIFPLVIQAYDSRLTSRRINLATFAVFLALGIAFSLMAKSSIPLMVVALMALINIFLSFQYTGPGGSHKVKAAVVKFLNSEFSYRSNNSLGRDKLKSKTMFNFPVDTLHVNDTIVGKVSGVPVEVFYVSAERFTKYYGYTYLALVPFLVFIELVASHYNSALSYKVSNILTGIVYIVATLFAMTQGGRSENSHEYKKEVFGGIVMWLAFNKDFSYITYGKSRANGNVLSNLTNYSKVRNGFAEVELESDDFMKEFEVYSQNQQEARYLLTPMFMEALCRIKANLNKPINFSFSRNAFYITFEQPNFVNTNILEVEDNFAHMAEFYYFLESIFDIVNELHLDNRIWTK